MGIGSLLGLPLTWMLVIYLGSLVLLVVSALFELDPVTQKPTTDLHHGQPPAAFTEWDTVWVVIRTAGVALLVTVICFLISVPVAFFVVKVAWRWARRGIVVAMLLPLWAGYLVKGYAWRAMVSPAGDQFAAAGTRRWWLPRVHVRLDAGLRHASPSSSPSSTSGCPTWCCRSTPASNGCPSSLLDASGDLGARPLRTFRSVILPLLLPVDRRRLHLHVLAVAGRLHRPADRDRAARSASCSATSSTACSVRRTSRWPPRFTLWPLLIIIVYLLAMKRLGAFENL